MIECRFKVKFGTAKVFFLMLSIFSVFIDSKAHSKYDGSRTNLRTKGTITLAGMFPIYCYGQQYRDCAELQPLYVLQVEAFLWGIGQANDRFNQLGYNNFTIGAWIKDSCDNGVTGLQQSLSFIKAQLDNNRTDGICSQLNLTEATDVFFGMTGAVTSVVSKRVAPVLEVFCIPLISSYATSPELSDSNTYPFFLRTVPEDVYQSLAVFELLKSQNWTYNSIVYEGTTYGDHFSKALQDHIKQHNINNTGIGKICIENSFRVTVENPNWDNLFKRLLKGKSRVVVLILDFSIARQFFAAAKKQLTVNNESHRFQWIGTDGWSRTDTVIAEAEDIAENSITTEPLSFNVPEFTHHLKTLTLAKIKRSQNKELLSTVLEAQHNCCTNHSKNCHGKEPCKDEYKILPPDAAFGRAHFVIESINTFAQVFELLLNMTCTQSKSCDFRSINANGSRFLDYLKNVSFQISNRTFRYFGKNQNNGPPIYSYFQRQKNTTDRKSIWTALGDVSFINADDRPEMKFNQTEMKTAIPELKIQESKQNCTPSCKNNEHKVQKSDSCCWGCELCGNREIVAIVDGVESCKACQILEKPDEDYRKCVPAEPLFPNLHETQFNLIIAAAAIGAGCTGMVGLLYVIRKTTALVQLRVPVITGILLTTILGIFVSPALFLLKPSKLNCLLHWCLIAMCFTASTACLAAKAIRLVNFSGVRFFDIKLFKTNWKTMTMQVCFICLGEIAMIAIWLLMRLQTADPFLTKFDSFTGKTFMICEQLDEKICLMLLIIPMMVTAIVPVYLIKKSNPKTTYATMESRQIILACITVLCLFILSSPLTIVVSEYRTKVTLHMVAVIAGGYALLLPMHLPNVFLIVFKRKQNTMSHLAVGRVTYNSWRRLKREDIILEHWLGEGHYGDAWKASLRLPINELRNRISKQDVVVKILKEGCSDRHETEFREEALLMSKLDHRNVISLVGLCMADKPMLLVIEYMNGGSLDKYLRRPDVQNPQVCDLRDLHHILTDVAKACQYLENEGYIHRDIAARNCLVQLVGADILKPKCTKLGDFGIAKDVKSACGEINDGERSSLPVAWTAPEGFEGRFSNKSDVWSFGVLMWEVFSWGSLPFQRCFTNSHYCPGPELTNDEIEYAICVRRERISDYPLPCNSTFPGAIQEIMERCWQYSPEERPSFKQTLVLLSKARPEVFAVNRQYCARVRAQSRLSANETNNNLIVIRSGQNMYLPSVLASHTPEPAYVTDNDNATVVRF